MKPINYFPNNKEINNKTFLLTGKHANIHTNDE